MSQHLVPEAKNGLSKFKNEVAAEMESTILRLQWRFKF